MIDADAIAARSRTRRSRRRTARLVVLVSLETRGNVRVRRRVGRCGLPAADPAPRPVAQSRRALIAGLAAYAWVKFGTSRTDSARIGIVIAVAYATHVLFDWLGADSSAPRGLMALWPLSSSFFISDLDVFDSVDRRYWLDGFVRRNTMAVARELAILLPAVGACFWYARLRQGRG